MASRDYILCKYCKCKLVYDGYDSIREGLEQTYGTNQLVCPDCLKKLEEIIRESEQKLKQSPAVEQEKPINQCDGCQAGMQCIDGLHYHNDKPVMACTKRLYIGKTTPVECEPVEFNRATPEEIKAEWDNTPLKQIHIIDEETRRMVLELCDFADTPYIRSFNSMKLAKQLRERIRP